MPPPARLGLLVAGTIALDLLVWNGATRTTTGSDIPGWLPGVVTIAAYQLLWLLRTRPERVLAAMSALAMVSMLVPKWQPFTGLLLAAYAAPAQRGARATFPLLAGVLLALGSHSYASARLTPSPLSSTATLLVLWVVFVGAIWGLGVRSHQRGRQAWWGSHLLSTRAERDLVAERLRIARDLHDGVSGAVTSIHLQAAGALCLQPTAPDLAARSLAAIESSAERTLVELRRVVGSLRTASPGCGPGSLPTLAELPHLVDIARQAGLFVTLTEVGARHPSEPAGPCRRGHRRAHRPGEPDQRPQTRRPGSAVRGAPRLGRERTPGHRCRAAPSAFRRRLRTSELPNGWSAEQGLSGLVERATLAGGHLQAGPLDDGFAVGLTVPTRAVVTR